MDNISKFTKAVSILRENTEMIFYGDVQTEEDFNNVEWVIGSDDKGTAITTTNNPHSELTWTKIKEEMDKL
jgi:hypothetical protein